MIGSMPEEPSLSSVTSDVENQLAFASCDEFGSTAVRQDSVQHESKQFHCLHKLIMALRCRFRIAGLRVAS